MKFALNHMTVARTSYRELLEIAETTECVGVELRIDLVDALFSGLSAKDAKQLAKERGLHILALAEISRFNEWTSQRAYEADELIEKAVACGAPAVVLIPVVSEDNGSDDERHSSLCESLSAIKPKLDAAGIRGFLEPLGFVKSSLRLKSEAIAAIEMVGGKDTFGLVHDTFHHALAGEPDLFPEYTRMVHVSGVTESGLAFDMLQDKHRQFVDEHDRLGNVSQLSDLISAGYGGPVSFEVFAPAVHSIANPAEALNRSMSHLRAAVQARLD